MAAQVTQEPMCVLSACELVFIVHVCMYGCFLHSSRLSSILFFGGLSFNCDMSETREKNSNFSFGILVPLIFQAVKYGFIALCLLSSLEIVEAWCGMDKQQQNTTVSFILIQLYTVVDA